MPAPPPKHNCCNAPVHHDQGCSPVPTRTMPGAVTHRYSFTAVPEGTRLALRTPDSTPVPRGTKLRAKNPGYFGSCPIRQERYDVAQHRPGRNGALQNFPGQRLHCNNAAPLRVPFREPAVCTSRRWNHPSAGVYSRRTAPCNVPLQAEACQGCPLCSSRRHPGNASIPPRR